jgi:anti-anti-sigma regulatory factor
MDLKFLHSLQDPGEDDMETQSAIMIKLPEAFGGKEARRLGRELKNRMSAVSPHIVVDFSRVREMDLAALEGLLDCMEIIAKNDGAVQLGEMSPEAAVFLELTRMDQLFSKFPAFDASSSFTSELGSESEEVVADKVSQAQPVAA